MLTLGIDIGGTSAKLGLVDSSGDIVARSRVPTGRDLSGDELVAGIARAAGAMAGRAAAVGIAAPGMRRDDGEGVVNVTNLPHIDGYPLRSALAAALGVPASLDNDANAAALGEARHGAGHGGARVLCVTLGTGIGAGMVVDGRVHRIACGGLGDPGHILVVPHGQRCGCGARGCVEAQAALPAIVRAAENLAGRRFTGIADVVTAANQGCAAAGMALEEAAKLIAVALVTLTHLLAPDRLLLGGGGFDAAGDLLMPPLERSFATHVQPWLAERMTLGRAALGNDAGIIGAACLPAAEA